MIKEAILELIFVLLVSLAALGSGHTIGLLIKKIRGY